MVTKLEKVLFICLIVAVALTAIFWKEAGKMVMGKDFAPPGKEHAEKAGRKTNTAESNNGVTVLEQWEMPDELTEISDICYLDAHRFACVQDEEGSIFIYNTAQNKIERKIPFAKPGDYEGLTLVGATAYVAKSNGTIYEIKDFKGKNPEVKEHKTMLTAKNDVEGICWDKASHQLLLTVKKDKGKDLKEIWSFDLATHQMKEEPACNIDLQHPLLKEVKDFRPSAIDIHPKSGLLYLLEGTVPQLLVMDRKGVPQQWIKLDPKQFRQPEGLTFSPSGQMYISNEGQSGKGNILKVTLP